MGKLGRNFLCKNDLWDLMGLLMNQSVNMCTALQLLVTVLVLSKLKLNTTATQPQGNVLKYFAIFKNVAHSLEPGETPSYSAYHQAPNYVQHS